MSLQESHNKSFYRMTVSPLNSLAKSVPFNVSINGRFQFNCSPSIAVRSMFVWNPSLQRL